MGQKNIENKLLLWNGIGVPRNDKKIYAEDYYCVKCQRDGKEIPAESFYGLNDPDATSSPYCKSCVKKLEMEYWIYVSEHPFK